MADEARYAMVISWSDEDQAYLVGFPEWEGHLLSWRTVTHGTSYEEAARAGREVLELLIETAQAEGSPLPPARVCAASA